MARGGWLNSPGSTFGSTPTIRGSILASKKLARLTFLPKLYEAHPIFFDLKRVVGCWVIGFPKLPRRQSRAPKDSFLDGLDLHAQFVREVSDLRSLALFPNDIEWFLHVLHLFFTIYPSIPVLEEV